MNENNKYNIYKTQTYLLMATTVKSKSYQKLLVNRKVFVSEQNKRVQRVSNKRIQSSVHL